MIGDDEQIGGRAKGRIWIGKEARVHVPVRADNRHVRGSLIQFNSNAADRRVGIEEAIFGENLFQRFHAGLHARAASSSASTFSGSVPGEMPPPKERISPPPGAAFFRHSVAAA